MYKIQMIFITISMKYLYTITKFNMPKVNKEKIIDNIIEKRKIPNTDEENK